MKKLTCVLGYDDFDVWKNGKNIIAIQFNDPQDDFPLVYKVERVNESDDYDLSGEAFFSDEVQYFKRIEDSDDNEVDFYFVKYVNENLEEWKCGEEFILIEYKTDTMGVRAIEKVYSEEKEGEYMNNEVTISRIIRVFEDFLEDKGIKIENSQRDADNLEDPYDVRTNIYGEDYYRLEDDLKSIINNYNEEERSLDEKADEIYNNYEQPEIVQAFWLCESARILEEDFEKNEKYIEEHKKGLADYLSEDMYLLDTEEFDRVAKEYMEEN